MNKIACCGGALFASLLLSSCAAEMGGGGVASDAQVTRFHLGQPIARGQIAVEAADSAEASSLEFNEISASVERELGRLGWTVEKGNARTEQVALIRIDQAARTGARRSGVSIGVGVGGGSYGRGGGVGVGVGGTIPITGGSNQVVATQLSVRIQRRSDATVAWEGRAETEARGNSPLAARSAAADRLATALFRDFPGESGRTIRVR
jgi:hypothetical protein